MKRRKLETSEEKTTTGRGAKPGDVRNPTGRGGFEPGKSGNPLGRPVGSGNKLPELNSVWDAWKKSNGLSWLFCALNFKIPMSIFDTATTTRSPEEIREIRSLLVKNYWHACDFVRKVAGDRLAREMDVDDAPMGLSEISAELRAKATGKLVAIEGRVRRGAAR